MVNKEANPKRYTGFIGVMRVVASKPYVVYGDVRGCLGERGTFADAMKVWRDDRDGCAQQNGYSDAYIYFSTGNGWEPVYEEQIHKEKTN